MCNHFLPPNYNNGNLKFFEPKFYRAINKFLKLHSNNNIISVVGFKKQIYATNQVSQFNYSSFNSTDIKFSNVLIIECRCKDGSGFSTMEVLGNMLYSTLKPLFTEFSDVRLEYHYSMYFSRD